MKNSPFCKQKLCTNNLIKWICQHPICSSYLELCEKCYITHKQKHETLKIENEPSQSDFFILYEDKKSKMQQILLKIREDLEKLQNIVVNETQALINPDLPIENLINDLQEIRKSMNKEFDLFIYNLREQFERPILNKFKDINEEINQKLNIVFKFLNSTDIDMHNTLKILSQNDFNYQVQFQKARLDQLIFEKRAKRYEGTIDNDVVLRFIGMLQQELKNLICFPEDSIQEELIIKQPENQTINTKESLFYFEPASKKFHYIDINKPNSTFQTIELNIDFQIYQNHRSLQAGQNIYLLGGYDYNNINSENENDYRYIYLLDFVNKTLIKVGSLITLRHSFGVCYLNEFIYVVGGYNYLEGPLSKCEKVSVQQCNKNVSIPINNLQQKAIDCCVCGYKDRYLFKFGGLQQHSYLKQKLHFVDNYFELYDIQTDQWIFNEKFAYFKQDITYLGGCVEFQDKIYIFGGIDQNKKPNKNLITIENQINSHNALNIKITKVNSFLISSCMVTSQSVIITSSSQNTIFYLESLKINEKDNQNSIMKHFSI